MNQNRLQQNNWQQPLSLTVSKSHPLCGDELKHSQIMNHCCQSQHVSGADVKRDSTADATDQRLTGHLHPLRPFVCCVAWFYTGSLRVGWSQRLGIARVCVSERSWIVVISFECVNGKCLSHHSELIPHWSKHTWLWGACCCLHPQGKKQTV